MTSLGIKKRSNRSHEEKSIAYQALVKPEKKSVNFKLHKGMYTDLRHLAIEEGTTATALVEEGIRMVLESRKK